MYKLWIVIILCLCTLVQSGWWVTFGESEYYFGTNRRNWYESRDGCRDDRDANLAVITSAEENNYLKQQIINTPYWIGLRQGPECWCGESVDAERCRTCRDSWTWYDGTPMGFHQWVDREPGNSDCGRLTPGGWTEYPCPSDFRYICERPLCQTWRCNNGYCEAANGAVYCICDSAYTGQHCDADIDECVQENPCLNDGTCNNQVGGYKCVCAPGWDGEHCEGNINECSTSPCQNNAQCHDTLGSYRCECAPGYGGDHCENEIDECASSPCRNNGVCEDGLNRYECNCTEQYHGVRCELDLTNKKSKSSSPGTKVSTAVIASILLSVVIVVLVVAFVIYAKRSGKLCTQRNNAHPSHPSNNNYEHSMKVAVPEPTDATYQELDVDTYEEISDAHIKGLTPPPHGGDTDQSTPGSGAGSYMNVKNANDAYYNVSK